MKKILLLAVFAIFVSSRTMALDDAPSFTAFSANYSFQNVNTDVYALKTAWPTDHDDNLAHGFNIGFSLQQKLFKWLVLVSGIQYQFTMATEDGVDLTALGGTSACEAQFFNHNLIVPIKLGFSIPFGGNGCFTIYGGPSLNFLVSTQMDYYYNSSNYVFTDIVNGKRITRVMGNRTITKSDDYRQMGWFDIPLGVGAMVKFGRFGIRFDYEWGMIDRWKGDGKFKSDQLTAGLVFAF